MTGITPTVRETFLQLPLVNRGKVRDIYAVGDTRLLIVTTDRLSAFDVVFAEPIPDKGKVLNQISLFWFDRFKGIVPNHFITADINAFGLTPQQIKQYEQILSGRSVLVGKAKPLPVECVVRGYLAGSGWKDYQKTNRVCGHRLPAGLRQCERLPQPIFTPATKATVGHDENISFEEMVKLVGEGVALEVKDFSIRLYSEGAVWAASRGIIIADTKFEFGEFEGKLILIDEVLTPDSSRFWPTEGYATGHDQPSFDKQIVRNWLTQAGWNKEPPTPKLPLEIIARTAQAYRDSFTLLTGRTLT